jgi:hypothetical protein
MAATSVTCAWFAGYESDDQLDCCGADLPIELKDLDQPFTEIANDHYSRIAA